MYWPSTKEHLRDLMHIKQNNCGGSITRNSFHTYKEYNLAIELIADYELQFDYELKNVLVWNQKINT